MKLSIGVLLAAVFWLAWPYWTLYSFIMAVRAGDPVAIEKHVSWVEVRQGLKDDFNAAFAKSIAEDDELKDNPFSGLAIALGPAVVNNVVDTIVTPQGLAALVTNTRPTTTQTEVDQTAQHDSTEATTQPALHHLRWAFFNGPNSFLVVFGGDDQGEPVRIVLKLRDFGWKITRIFVPLDELQSRT
jgi:hypothetical protein